MSFISFIGPKEEPALMIFDTGSGFSIISEALLARVAPNVVIRPMENPLRISGVNTQAPPETSRGVALLLVIIPGDAPRRLIVPFVVLPNVHPDLVLLGMDNIRAF